MDVPWNNIIILVNVYGSIKFKDYCVFSMFGNASSSGLKTKKKRKNVHAKRKKRKGANDGNNSVGGMN